MLLAKLGDRNLLEQVRPDDRNLLLDRQNLTLCHWRIPLWNH